ncbi:unnamed protein product [Thelazia callipaeda]|uniref:MICOS complex subunit MIC10 n=1 Tax=Thelazia callipaeda TaxID=103827 RepID=A0A0N5D0G8_THECL|nr:unnamed protein product [Thelazia callipaeda]
MVKKSEDELNETLDRCLADTALKIVGAGTIGLIVGIVCKRQFPVWLGIGTGFGMGIANCRHDMKRCVIPMDEKRIDCLDLLAFQDMLNKLRQIDDKILFELNTALPSKSFSANIDKGEKCRSVYEQLITMRARRMDLIQRCIDENQDNINYLREKKAPLGNIRNAQNTLRVIRSEMDIENIVNERSQKAVHDRCRNFL